jgi:hypothetical protein
MFDSEDEFPTDNELIDAQSALIEDLQAENRRLVVKLEGWQAKGESAIERAVRAEGELERNPRGGDDGDEWGDEDDDDHDREVTRQAVRLAHCWLRQLLEDSDRIDDLDDAQELLAAPAKEPPMTPEERTAVRRASMKRCRQIGKARRHGGNLEDYK